MIYKSDFNHEKEKIKSEILNGALALGGALGTVAVIVRQEIVLAIMGGIFVAETLSVAAQVLYFRLKDGTEVVQLYIRDLVGSVTRPVKELKGFERIFLKAGESQKVSFKITPDLLTFYNYRLDFVCEPGESTQIGRASCRERV